MIELLMVIMLVSVLSSIALPQYLDFRKEGRIATAAQMSQSITAGIRLQFTQSILRCNNVAKVFPPLDSVTANDITTGTAPLCSTSEITNAPDRRFVDSAAGQLPANPINSLRTVGAAASLAVGESYSTAGTCTASPTGTIYGWCYDDASGVFFAAVSY